MSGKPNNQGVSEFIGTPPEHPMKPLIRAVLTEELIQRIEKQVDQLIEAGVNLRAERDALQSTIEKHNNDMHEHCQAARDFKTCEASGTKYRCSTCPRKYLIDAARKQTETGDAD